MCVCGGVKLPSPTLPLFLFSALHPCLKMRSAVTREAYQPGATSGGTKTHRDILKLSNRYFHNSPQPRLGAVYGPMGTEELFSFWF